MNDENNFLFSWTKLGDKSEEKKRQFVCRLPEAVQQVLCQLYMTDTLSIVQVILYIYGI